MRLSELLAEDVIKVEMESRDKEEAFEELMALLVRSGKVKDPQRAMAAILSREQLQSTGIGRGLGIPHGKDASIGCLSCALGLSHEGIEYDSLDGEPVRVVFMVLAEKGNPGPHIEALSQIAKLFMMEGFLERLLKARTAKEVRQVFADCEETED